LKEKLISTYEASLKPEYSTFLKNFVQYKPKLEVEEIGSTEFFIKQFDQIHRQLAQLTQGAHRSIEDEAFSSRARELRVRLVLPKLFRDFVAIKPAVLDGSSREVVMQFSDYVKRQAPDLAAEMTEDEL
jgi:hypothetical protein